MALSAGARLGPYEVLGPIGAGGMGEVYRARDTRLRPVAEIEGNWVAGLSVSPDGRTIAWGRSLVTSDLMMIEDFR